MEEKETFPTRAKDDVHAAVCTNRHTSYLVPTSINFCILFRLFLIHSFILSPHISFIILFEHWNTAMRQGELVHFTNHTELWKLDAINVTITSGNRSSMFKRVRFVFE